MTAVHWEQADVHLDCYPKVPSHISRPWDAADEYLHRELSDTCKQGVLLINDRHGALSCTFPDAISWCDDACSIIAIHKNRLRNQLTEPCVITTSEELDNLSSDQPIDNVIIKIPKNFDLLKHWLSRCQSSLPDNTTYWLAGMAKHTPVNWLNWLEENSGSYQQYPVRKKARIIRITLTKDLAPLNSLWRGYRHDGIQFNGLPGVFSRETVDIGSRFLLETCDNKLDSSWFNGDVCDLGCGNGLLGISLAVKHPAIKLTMADTSALAVEAAKHNAKAAGVEVQVFHSDCLREVEYQFDRILCNPPFHDGHVQLLNIATQMFTESARKLRQNGELLVVANRHLPYLKELRRLFKRTSILNQNQKFVIYRCAHN